MVIDTYVQWSDVGRCSDRGNDSYVSSRMNAVKRGRGKISKERMFLVLAP